MSVLSQDNELSEAPRFELDAEGKVAHVTVAVEDYLRLLINCSITEPEQWPEEYREGAALLAKVRGIERACIEANAGEFNFDTLSAEAQDEYDVAIVQLERLTDDGARFSLEDVADELGINVDELHSRVH